MNEKIELNSAELAALHGAPHLTQLVYIYLLSQADEDGVIGGNNEPIQWTDLARRLWVKPRPGERNSGVPNPNSLRVRATKFLIDLGLIEVIATKPRRLRCILADCAKTPNKKKPLSRPAKKSGKPLLPTEDDYLVAQKLLEIKQRVNPNARSPNMDIWAEDIRNLQNTISLPDRTAGTDNHKITTEEMVMAWEYAHIGAPFWAQNKIITSPKQLKHELQKTQKPTFRNQFLSWLESGGPDNEAISGDSGKYSNPSPTESIRDGVHAAFKEIGINL